MGKNMKIEKIKIEKLKPYRLNAKKHPQSQIEGIAESIKRFGFTQPIVIDGNDEIIIGHGRLEAAKILNLEEVPCVCRDDLKPEEIKALRLIDNRISETGWDQEILKIDLENLDFDFSSFNIDFEDLKFDETAKDGLTDDDAVPDAPVEPVTKLGDIYILGEHRLLCGDCTDMLAVEKLMGGLKADMVFTDPPYNVGYNPDIRPIGGRARSKNKLGAIKNDKMDDGDFLQFLRDIFASYVAASKDGGAIYVCHADNYGLLFRQAFQEVYHLSGVLIWSKNNFAIGRCDYHWQHEPMLYGWRQGATHQWHGDRSQTTVWNVSKGDPNKYVHPTQKPVELVEKALKNSSKSGDLILDFFGGSGSTMIACEENNRQCYSMELDPKFCDVIVKRWEDFTGRKAKIL